MPPVSEELGAGDASASAAATLSPSPPLGVAEEGKPPVDGGGWPVPTEEEPLAANGVGAAAAAEEEEEEEEKEKGEKKEKENGELLQPPPPPEKKEEEEEAKEAVAAEAFEPPEGGWGWLVMLASMWCNGAVFGIQNSCGVLFKSMLAEFGDPQDKQLMFRTALVNSLSMGMIFFCSPIVSIFTNIFGCRKVAVGGAAVAFIGLLSSSFVSKFSDKEVMSRNISTSGAEIYLYAVRDKKIASQLVVQMNQHSVPQVKSK